MATLGIQHWSFINASYSRVATTQGIDWEILELARPYTKVVALGNFASAALDRAGIPHYRLPHPSPLNRKLNDPAYEKTVLAECYNYLTNEN